MNTPEEFGAVLYLGALILVAGLIQVVRSWRQASRYIHASRSGRIRRMDEDRLNRGEQL